MVHENCNIPPTKIDTLPPPLQEMRDVQLHLNRRNCFGKRSGIEKDEAAASKQWAGSNAGALKPAYADAGFDLWAITHVDERAQADAQAQRPRGKPGDITIGTLIKMAKDGNFVMLGPSDANQRVAELVAAPDGPRSIRRPIAGLMPGTRFWSSHVQRKRALRRAMAGVG